MVVRWIVLDLINGTYSKLYTGKTAYFEKYEWAKRAADSCNRAYKCDNRFEILEVEI